MDREGLMGHVMVGGCFGHGDHKMAKFKIFAVTRKKRSAEFLSWISRKQTSSYLAVSPGNLLLRA